MQFVTAVYFLSTIGDAIIGDISHIDPASDAPCVSYNGDAAIDCKAHYYNSGARSWKVISKTLDIDFIHGDIHGQSDIFCRVCE